MIRLTVFLFIFCASCEYLGSDQKHDPVVSNLNRFSPNEPFRLVFGGFSGQHVEFFVGDELIFNGPIGMIDGFESNEYCGDLSIDLDEIGLLTMKIDGIAYHHRVDPDKFEGVLMGPDNPHFYNLRDRFSVPLD